MHQPWRHQWSVSSCSQDTVGMTQTTSHRRWNYTDLLRIPCTMLRLATTSSQADPLPTPTTRIKLKRGHGDGHRQVHARMHARTQTHTLTHTILTFLNSATMSGQVGKRYHGCRTGDMLRSSRRLGCTPRQATQTTLAEVRWSTRLWPQVS